MSWFASVAPFLKDPLVLIGLGLALVTAVFRAILVAKGTGMLPRMTRHDGAQVIFSMMRYLFALAALLVVLGFGLRAYDMSRNSNLQNKHIEKLEKTQTELVKTQTLLVTKIDELTEAIAQLSPAVGKYTPPAAGSIRCAELHPGELETIEAALSGSGLNPPERSQRIQLLRDGMFKACQAYSAGAIDADGYKAILERYQSVQITLMAVEQLSKGGAKD